MIVLGLTGSIGMGKSTTAGLFAQAGAYTWNADATVHRLYAQGGRAVKPVGALFPGVIVDGAVDRTRLAQALGSDAKAFARLEAVVHPLVGAHRLEDLAQAETDGFALAVLDIPLLFEKGLEVLVDAVVVVTADPEVQAARVLARPGMTRARLGVLLARQTPDAEKRRRADFVIDTGQGMAAARDAVARIVETVTDPLWTPPRARLHPVGEQDQ